jgi:hypothetical protein
MTDSVKTWRRVAVWGTDEREQSFCRIGQPKGRDSAPSGAARSNKGGNALQEGSYRTIYQMGMGLKAQLMAAL